MKRRAVVALGFLLVLILMPGCGDDAASGEAGTGLSQAAFIRQADEICQQAETEIARKNIAQLRKLANDPKSREKLEYKLVETSLVPVLEDEVAQLEALGTPPGDAAQIEQMLELIEGAVAEGKAKPETYVAGDSYRWGSEHFGKAHRLAVGYGMKHCPVSE